MRKENKSHAGENEKERERERWRVNSSKVRSVPYTFLSPVLGSVQVGLLIDSSVKK